jgi:hypothetical protein
MEESVPVGNGRVLHLDLPIGPAAANAVFQVTFEPLTRKPMTPEEWRAWRFGKDLDTILDTARVRDRD